jgi:hypothetical protein
MTYVSWCNTHLNAVGAAQLQQHSELRGWQHACRLPVRFKQVAIVWVCDYTPLSPMTWRSGAAPVVHCGNMVVHTGMTVTGMLA